MNTTQLTATEIRVLRSLHLRGIMGEMGSMKLKERTKLLNNLINNGYITQSMNLTAKGIEASK